MGVGRHTAACCRLNAPNWVSAMLNQTIWNEYPSGHDAPAGPIGPGGPAGPVGPAGP